MWYVGETGRTFGTKLDGEKNSGNTAMFDKHRTRIGNNIACVQTQLCDRLGGSESGG